MVCRKVVYYSLKMLAQIKWLAHVHTVLGNGSSDSWKWGVLKTSIHTEHLTQFDIKVLCTWWCLHYLLCTLPQALVLNTKTNQHWQTEERPPNFPLLNGQPTQLTAAINDQAIDVYANRKQFSYSYRHRYNVEKVNRIYCYGSGIPITMFVGKVRAHN